MCQENSKEDLQSKAHDDELNEPEDRLEDSAEESTTF